MRVWITRTEPGATRLAAAIRQLGLATFKAPVLRIEPRRKEPPQGLFDLALFVSEHAVAHAARNGWTRAPWRDCPTAAVGASASNALRGYGVEPCTAVLADAVSVLDALAAVPQRALIVKGQGGRNALQCELRRRGSTVVEWDVYRRAAIEPDLAGQDVDAIVASSGAAVCMVAKAWFADGRAAATAALGAFATRCRTGRAGRLRERRCYTRRVGVGGRCRLGRTSASAVGAALGALMRRSDNGERRLG